MRDRGREHGPGGAAGPLAFVDPLKGVAILWIILNHLVERSFGYPLLGNPQPGWPPLGERLRQLLPLTGHGPWDLPLNLLRYLGWAGDQGVQLFLIVSGAALCYAQLGREVRPLAFYRRRFLRIYPAWWAAHLLFVLPLWLRGHAVSPADTSFYLSLLGVRITPALFRYLSHSWWYVGLLLQLYLLFPLLLAALRRLGPTRLLLLGCAAAFAARAAGLYLLGEYMGPYLRGAIFLTRLPEFLLGMCLGASLRRDPEGGAERPRRWAGAAALLYALGTALSLSVAGMVVAPLCLGAGAFGLLYGPLRSGGTAWLRWLGLRSYGIYLVHQPLIELLVPRGLGRGAPRILAGAAAALLLTLVLGPLLERVAAVRVRLNPKEG